MRPSITVSVVAQSNLSSAFFNLIHGVIVTSDNAKYIAELAVRKLTKLEFQIVRGIRTAGLTGGNDEATLAQTLQSATGVLRSVISPLVSFYLFYLTIGARLLPEDAAPYLLLFTDAVSSFAPDNASGYDNQLMEVICMSSDAWRYYNYPAS